MNKFRFTIKLVAIAIFMFAFASIAQAQATRTWVSGVGDDANPCSRTAPCKTFAGAISKTAPLGTINCLDPGGFGGVTITKSIALICDYTEAGVLVSGTNAIVVNTAATDIVTLKGLDIEGLGTGLNGIRFIGAGTLHVHKTQIRGFRGASGNGISFAPTGFGELFVDSCYIQDNGTFTTAGILIKPTGSGSANVTINRTQLENNTNGIIADGSASTGVAVNITVRDSLVGGGSASGIVATTIAARAAIGGVIDNTLVTGNAASGVKADGATASGLGSAIVRVNNSAITLNVSGITALNSGQVRSFTNNVVTGNLNSEVFTGNDLPL